MNKWINPYTRIEHDADKRSADMTNYKTRVNEARAKMTQVPAQGKDVWAEFVKAKADYKLILESMGFWVARTDFITAALNAGKTDDDILKMIVPTIEDDRIDINTVFFKALVVELGGTNTNLLETANQV